MKSPEVRLVLLAEVIVHGPLCCRNNSGFPLNIETQEFDGGSEGGDSIDLGGRCSAAGEALPCGHQTERPLALFVTRPEAGEGFGENI